MAVNQVSEHELAGIVHQALKREPIAQAVERARGDLRPKELLAVELLHDGIATCRSEACRMAGYAETTAKNAGSVFGRARVALAVELGKRLKSAGAEITAETYRSDLGELANADPSGAYGEDGRLLHLRDWPAPLRRMVKSLRLSPLGQVEAVTFEGRAGIMALLGKHKLVGAFDQARKETRTYIIRDYTGEQSQAGQLPSGQDVPVDVTDQVERIDQVDASTREQQGDPRIAPKDIDVGFIPLRDKPRRPATTPDPPPGPGRTTPGP